MSIIIEGLMNKIRRERCVIYHTLFTRYHDQIECGSIDTGYIQNIFAGEYLLKNFAKAIDKIVHSKFNYKSRVPKLNYKPNLIRFCYIQV